MTKKIFITGSVQWSNLYSFGTRAEQIEKYNEGTQVQQIVDYMLAELSLYDVDAIRSPKTMDLNASAKMANYLGCESYYAIHSNAGGGKGTTALKQTSLFVPKANRVKSALMATELTNAIEGLGRINRGTYGRLNSWKGEWYSDLRQPKMAASILEIDFHDWPDAAAWIINNKELIGRTIARAIAKIEGLVLKAKPVVVPAIAYKVQVTASVLNIRTGPGVSYPVVGAIRDKGVYTIVETIKGWGRLKSGAGWISLYYTKKI